jgi:hypothetical protein
MAEQTNTAGTEQTRTGKRRLALSLDGWAVAIALALAALVRFGVLKHVAW